MPHQEDKKKKKKKKNDEHGRSLDLRCPQRVKGCVRGFLSSGGCLSLQKQFTSASLIAHRAGGAFPRYGRAEG